MNFVKNEILEMWILSKIRFWNCEFCQKWDFHNVNFWINWGFLPQCGKKKSRWIFIFFTTKVQITFTVFFPVFPQLGSRKVAISLVLFKATQITGCNFQVLQFFFALALLRSALVWFWQQRSREALKIGQFWTSSKKLPPRNRCLIGR